VRNYWTNADIGMKFNTQMSVTVLPIKKPKKKRFVRIKEPAYFKLKISPYFLITVVLGKSLT